MTERTLAIIKPDAVERRLAGKIIQRIEDEGFQIRAMRKVSLSKAQAEGFYAVHRERPFFGSLTAFMREEMTLEQARRTLGLSARASDVDVRRAFKQLALMHHPDRNGGAARAAERFRKICLAYEILTGKRAPALEGRRGSRSLRPRSCR